MNEAMKILEELKSFTKECREDMHEPDEQGIGAFVVGNHLDNAFGTRITIDAGFQEFIVILQKEDDKIFKINLADLIALARKADLAK